MTNSTTIIRELEDLEKSQIKKIEKLDYSPTTVAADDFGLGATFLPLITDWSWIKRRVESIEVVDNGNTKRQLSLDLVLPFHKSLGYPEGPSAGEAPCRQTIVPLSFLRKGMLVNFSLRDEDGSPLPALSFSENGKLTYQAITFLTAQINLASLVEDLNTSLLDALESQPEGFDLNKTLKRGISEIIFSSSFDKEAISYETINRPQETHRRDLFDSIAALAGSLLSDAEENRKRPIPDDRNKNVDYKGIIPLSLWAKGAKFRDRDELKRKKESGEISDQKTPYVLDSSFNVHILALSLIHAIKESVNSSDKKLEELELLANLLSVVSSSYLCAVVVDTDNLWADVDAIKPNQDSKRTVIKLNCNVEINDDKADSQESSSFFGQFIKPLVKPLFRPHNPHLDVLIRSTARSAKSTHIEFGFPHGMQLKSIHAFSPTSTDKRLEYLTEERPEILMFNFDKTRRKVSSQNGNRNTGPEDRSETSEEEPFSQATDPKYRHGSFRSSFNRVHIQPNKKTSSLETLSFRLAPEPMVQPILAIVTTFLSLTFSSTVFWRQTQGLEQSPQHWFTFAEFLAAVTLLTALYGALFVTGNLHVVLRLAYRQPRYLIGASSVLGIFAPFLLVYYLYLGDDSQPSHTVTIPIWIVIGTLWAFWVRLAELTYKYSQDTKLDLEKFYLERVIPEEPSPHHHDRNVVAITETGMYDLDYLDENNLTALGISNDSETHWKKLAELGTTISSQWRNQSAKEN